MPLKSQALLEKIKEKIAAADPNPANRKVLVVISLIITEGDKQLKQYTIDLKTLKVTEGPYSGSPDFTITVDDEAMVQIGNKTLSTVDALKQGKAKVEGNENTAKHLAVLEALLGYSK